MMCLKGAELVRFNDLLIITDCSKVQSRRRERDIPHVMTVGASSKHWTQDWKHMTAKGNKFDHQINNSNID